MLVRYDPFRELERFTGQLPSADGGIRRSVPMDAYRRGDAVFLHFDLPGVDPSAIEVTTDKGTLTVHAERPYPSEEGDDVLCRERTQSFSRQVLLSETLDVGAIEANYDQGVLSLRIPMRESAKPHRVAISTG
ncbi:MAG: Hsp20/alpha crystallin family protein [Acidimicrobiia bacterium]|nr:Hsp20/alpha crystallin family protein [Acidimicrobiia bacterium]